MRSTVRGIIPAAFPIASIKTLFLEFCHKIDENTNVQARMRADSKELVVNLDVV